jgi:2-hydroxy-6-oxonona-2,4-dienedioate hydrolase
MDASRYLEAEERFWSTAGVQPVSRRVHLDRLDVVVRVQEVGEGPPVLFVHGGPNSGSTWAPLVAHLSGMRCLLLDRPGTGMSEALPDSRRVTPATLRPFADTLVADVLDGLELEDAHLVASSFGGYVALRFAARHPRRVRRMVQMACPALVAGTRTPPFMRALALPPVRRLLGELPPSPRAARSIFRQIGHGASLDADRIPPALFDWYLALQRHTDTFANETEMIASLVSPLRGFERGVTLEAEVLASVTCPVRFLWGADDAFGGEDVARRLVAGMPDAELEMLPAAGHLPWLDDPEHAASRTASFLLGDRARPTAERELGAGRA